MAQTFMSSSTIYNIIIAVKGPKKRNTILKSKEITLTSKNLEQPIKVNKKIKSF